MKIWISVLKICFSFFIVILTGCSITGGFHGNVWPAPSKPVMKPVEIVPMSEAGFQSGGYYLSPTNALNLANNVDELKAYAQKLEVLVNKISNYYGDKIEER